LKVTNKNSTDADANKEPDHEPQDKKTEGSGAPQEIKVPGSDPNVHPGQKQPDQKKDEQVHDAFRQVDLSVTSRTRTGTTSTPCGKGKAVGVV